MRDKCYNIWKAMDGGWEMVKDNNKFIWLPRGLAIAMILFLSTFALDVFSGHATFLQYLGGLFYHLIPSLVILGLLIIYWSEPRYCGIVFIILSLLFTLFFKTYSNWISFLVISFPLIIIGVLFIVANTCVSGLKQEDIDTDQNE